VNHGDYKQPSVRRYKASVSVFGTTQIHLRNPFVIAFWSALFPGMGHLLLSKYLRGYVLFIWEIVINVKANVNLAIIYSFTGKFAMAKEVLDKDWLLLYLPTFLFAIWDSYRTTVDINKQYILAAREDAEITPFIMNAIEINYLDKRTPWNSAIWSLIAPGTGQLLIHRVPSMIFVIIWWIVIVYLSKLLPAIHHTLMGNFEQARAVVNPHWFINIPSLYLFSMYDAYENTVANNNLFDWEQTKFLNRDYQNKYFNMPSKRKKRGESMHIISTFEHSINLESAITAIQMKGISKEDILAIPLDKKSEKISLFDSIHYSDSLSLLDLPVVLAALLMIFGSIYGFILAWGPVLWGLIGMLVGLGIGFIIKFFTTKKYKNRQNNKNPSEVVLIIECKENQIEMVKNTLWSHEALGVRKLILGEDNQ
jgi:hypothetical protein